MRKYVCLHLRECWFAARLTTRRTRVRCTLKTCQILPAHTHTHSDTHTFIQFRLKSASFATRYYSPCLEMKGSQQSEQQWHWQQQQQHHRCSTNFNLYALNVESESWRARNYTHKNTTKYELSIKFVLAHGNPNISSWINVWQCAATVKLQTLNRKNLRRRKQSEKKFAEKKWHIYKLFEQATRVFEKKNFCISNRVCTEVWTETRTTSNS